MIKRHYEKIIVGCCFLFVFVNIGLASTAFSVHQPYLVAIEGIGDTGGSLILSVRTLVSFFSMLVVDRYYRLLDVRRGVLVACLCTATGFCVYSVAPNLPAFMAGAVFLGLGYGLGGMVAMTYLANRWFATGIGSVVGFASMGSGIASIVMPIVVVHVIESASLSAAFLVEGGVAVVVGLLVFLLMRNRPSDVGLQPYAGKPSKMKRPREKNGSARSSAEEQSGTAGEVAAPKSAGLRAWRIMLLAAVAGVGTFCCCGVTYLSVLATSNGFDPLFAALLVSMAGTALTVAKFVVGELFDHLGGPRASIVMFTLAGVGFALCCLAGAGSKPVMVCAALAMGAGLSLGTVGVSVWSLDLSAPAERSRQIKNFQVAYALGGFIANTLPGLVKDIVGTYIVSYAAMVVVIIAAAAIILRAYHRR